MGADWETFAIRFKEHDPAENWEERLLEIVDRLKAFDPPCGNPFRYPDVFNINREKKFCEMIRYDEVYGNMDHIYDAIEAFFDQEFPSVDYELHWQEMYGDLGDNITIVEDGTKYHGGTGFDICWLDSDDKDDKQENPYHIPDDIRPLFEEKMENMIKESKESDLSDLREETAYLFWFCDQFK